MNNNETKLFYDPADDKKPDGSPVDTLRTSAIYKQQTAAFLTGVRGRTGTVQTTANLLLEKFADELKRNGITDYDPDAYELAIGKCRIQLGVHGSAVEQPASGPKSTRTAEATGGNERRGTKRVGRTPKGASDKRADVGSAHSGNGRQGGES